MEFSILLIATLFVISASESQPEENRQMPKNGEHVPWGNWIGSMGGPQAFRLELIEALRSLLHDEETRTELMEIFRSEKDDAAIKANEFLSKLPTVCENRCRWEAPCVHHKSYNPCKNIKQVFEESCHIEMPNFIKS